MAITLPTGWRSFVSGCDVPLCLFEGQQVIQYKRRFAQNRGGNGRTSWGYISPSEEVYQFRVTDAASDGGNALYDSAGQILEHFTGPTNLGDPPIGTVPKVPTGTNGPAVNCRPGISDEPAYLTSGETLFLVNSNTAVVFAPNSGSVPSWVKDGVDYFTLFSGGAPDFRRYNLSGALVQSSSALDGLAGLNHLCVTANFIYVLTDNGSPHHQQILKFNRAAMTLAATLELGDINASVIYALSDDRIDIGALFARSGGKKVWYYWDTQLRYVGIPTPLDPLDTGDGLTSFPNRTCRVLAFGTGAAEQRYFYWGSSGFSGLDTDIFRMGPVECTETPLNPSVSAPATGTLNTDITITWAGILEPDVNDYVVLIKNTVPYFYMATSDNISAKRQATGALASGGTMTFHIPATFTAGTYQVFLGAQNTFVFLASGGNIVIS